MIKIKRGLLMMVALFMLLGCSEKYTTEVFSEHLKMRTYKDRVVYDFNNGDVQITVNHEDTLQVEDILELTEHDENIFTLSQPGDLNIFVVDKVDKTLGAYIIITKFDLPRYHELYKESGEYKIGYMTLPKPDERRVDLLNRLDIQIK